MRFWTSVDKKLPPIGKEVIGWSKDWINPDYNPNGTCVCFLDDEGWTIAWWCNSCDEYHTKHPGNEEAHRLDIGPPTHWTWKPIKPIKK